MIESRVLSKVIVVIDGPPCLPSFHASQQHVWPQNFLPFFLYGFEGRALTLGKNIN